MTKARVLVIEDEEALRLALVDALRSEGFDVLEAADGERGLELALSEAPELVLLDLMLPKRDGFSVLRAIREDRLQSAVIVLSARGEEWDRIQGFEFGADDYVVKPFSTRELFGRMRAVLQRIEGKAPGLPVEAGKVTIGECVVDFSAYTFERKGARAGLSRKELELLRFLLDHEGQVLDRMRIQDAVWGRGNESTPRTVDMHVLKLRRKLEREPDHPRHILTVHGVGYRFSRTGEDARRS
ncbi:MAG: response regulator transcription factor [Planctomycetaceae bacterium]|nr:response regulator transcription factor [Planctomycetaceae bacterium]